MSSGNFKIHNSLPTPIFEQGLKDAALDKLQVVSLTVNVPVAGAAALSNIYRLVAGQYIASVSAVVTDDVVTGGDVVLSVSSAANAAGTDVNTFANVAGTIAVNAAPLVNAAYPVPRVADLVFVNLRSTAAVTGAGKVNVTLFLVNP